MRKIKDQEYAAVKSTVIDVSSAYDQDCEDAETDEGGGRGFLNDSIETPVYDYVHKNSQTSSLADVEAENGLANVRTISVG